MGAKLWCVQLGIFESYLTFQVPNCSIHSIIISSLLSLYYRSKSAMLDPVTAIGLASNILQFVVYGRRLIAEGYTLYRSSDGTLADHVKLETITTDFLQFSEQLVASPSPDSGEVEALRKLATSGRDTAVELLSVLNDLKLPEGPNRILQSLRQALRTARKREKIQKIEMDLDKLQKLLNLRLTAMMRYYFPFMRRFNVRTPLNS